MHIIRAPYARRCWRERGLFWLTDNTDTVVKQGARFISPALWNAPRRKTKAVRLTGSPLNDISQHHLEAWMCVFMRRRQISS